MKKNIINTDFGTLAVTTKNGYIRRIAIVDDASDKIFDVNIAKDIKKYFKGETCNFTSKFKLRGTFFEKSVWRELLKIPYGETRTYSEIAEAIGKPSAFRAVANACGSNKIPFVIPCHRVVGKNNLGGFYWGLDRKLWLMELEGIIPEDFIVKN